MRQLDVPHTAHRTPQSVIAKNVPQPCQGRQQRYGAGAGGQGQGVSKVMNLLGLLGCEEVADDHVYRCVKSDEPYGSARL
jgi:hypothetical protein